MYPAKTFKDLFSHFPDFLRQIDEIILATSKQEVEPKSKLSKWFCFVKIFSFILTQSNKAAFVRKFTLSLVVFLAYIFITFFLFLYLIFSKWFFLCIHCHF